MSLWMQITNRLQMTITAVAQNSRWNFKLSQLNIRSKNIRRLHLPIQLKTQWKIPILRITKSVQLTPTNIAISRCSLATPRCLRTLPEQNILILRAMRTMILIGNAFAVGKWASTIITETATSAKATATKKALVILTRS